MKLAGAYINDDTYGRLVALAAANNRTLAGECRHLFDRALRGELQVPEGPATLPQQQAAGMAAAKPWKPQAAPAQVITKQPLRAAPRALATLKAGVQPGSAANPRTNAGAGINLQPTVHAAVNPPSLANAALNPRLAAKDALISPSVPGSALNAPPFAVAALNPPSVPDAPLCSRMVGNTTPHPQPVAGAALNPPPVAGAAPHGVRCGCENVPVAGVVVVAGVPVGTGIVSTPAWPATGLPHPVRSAVYPRPGEVDEDGNGDEDGEEDGEEVGDDARRSGARFFQSPPLPMPLPDTKTNPATNTTPNHPRPCLHTTPSPLPRPALQDAHAPRNPARRTPR